MNERERVARESGAAKVFLKPDEVGLLAAAVTWVRTDVTFTQRLLEQSAPKEVAEQVPPELFSNWNDLLEALHRTLVMHALADTQETSDRGAQATIESSLKSWLEQCQQVQQVALAVRMAVLAESPENSDG